MQPTRPVCEGLELYEKTLGGPENNQPEYIPLPVLRSPDGRVMSRWTLTDEERKAVAGGADVCLMLYGCHGQTPPSMLYVTATNPSHTPEHLRECMMLDDEMELRSLGNRIRDAEEEMQKAQDAFSTKTKEIHARLGKSCPGSSSTSEENNGQQNSAPSEG